MFHSLFSFLKMRSTLDENGRICSDSVWSWPQFYVRSLMWNELNQNHVVGSLGAR